MSILKLKKLLAAADNEAERWVEEKRYNLLTNLAKDGVLSEILDLIDEEVKSRLIYNDVPSDSIFEDVITEELAKTFLYRLAKLS